MEKSIPDLLLDSLLFILEHALYSFEVYPRESFALEVFYGMEVHHTRHPEVQEYLDGLRSNLDKIIQKKRLIRVFYDFEVEGSTISLGISFGELFSSDGNGIGWKVLSSPSEQDSWITIVAALKTWFLQTRASIDLLADSKATDFEIRISGEPDDDLILDSHWGLDSTNRMPDTNHRIISFERIPEMKVDLGNDGKLKLHSYLVNKKII